MHTLGRTGLADAVLRASTWDRECWVARFGRVVEKRPGDQQGTRNVQLAPLLVLGCRRTPPMKDSRHYERAIDHSSANRHRAQCPEPRRR